MKTLKKIKKHGGDALGGDALGVRWPGEMAEGWPGDGRGGM